MLGLSVLGGGDTRELFERPRKVERVAKPCGPADALDVHVGFGQQHLASAESYASEIPNRRFAHVPLEKSCEMVARQMHVLGDSIDGGVWFAIVKFDEVQCFLNRVG